ncbi:hypothetical protein N9850_02245 [Granulosicoccus sp.]|nr:hypothetical protein [Granulosicoccus sp.]MDB4222565.1 hypothetical protein [Granulosicoccus sp.]
MAAIALLAKDVREHWVSLLFLSLGCITVFLLLLIQNKGAAFSMSSLEIVRYALLYLMPVVALIVGNRLIVNEYLSGTRLFVEALPLGQSLPLILKYLTGLCYLSFLAVLLILLSVNSASLADEITSDYVLLIISKTLVMIWLYWSIVFCFSLCGYLRVMMYLLLIGMVAAFVFSPSLNSDLIPPIALMDQQLFVFERDVTPWFAIIGTGLLAVAFSIAGFVLVRVGEGSVIERLSKPMTRRDFVAVSVLIAAGLGIWTAILEKNAVNSVEFTSSQVVRMQDPAVSVLYLQEQYQSSALVYAERLSESLVALQASLGLETLPTVKLALAPDREKHDVDYATSDGVFVSANWLEHDSYDDAILDSVLMHGVLSAQTQGRAMTEPYHWVLDGFTRWWVEQGTHEINPEHEAELLARALWTLDIEPSAQHLITRWQLTADRFAYPSAEALAWSAMVYLEKTQGREKVLALAIEFLTRPVGHSILASFMDRRESSAFRVENIIGMPVDEFMQSWVVWLDLQKLDPMVVSLLERIPSLQGSVSSEYDSSGIHRLTGSYELIESELNYSEDLESLPGACSMKHDYIGPFDTEFDVSDNYEDTSFCQIELPTHSVDSFYAQGDRVFIALDYEGGDFHQPLRLHAERLSIQ